MIIKQEVKFKVNIADPCPTSKFNEITFVPDGSNVPGNTFTVKDGQKLYITMSGPVLDIVSNKLATNPDCGNPTFEIFADR